MSPVEIIAYRVGEGSDQVADIDVFEGTETQLQQSRQDLVDSWKQIAGEQISIVYQGTDLKEAKETIKGLQRISEDVNFS